MNSRSPSQRAAQKVLDQEFAIAERRGADRVRAQVRDVLEDRRRVVRRPAGVHLQAAGGAVPS